MGTGTKLHIGIIGGGVAGIGAAYLLQRKYRVTLLEKNDYLGGHTHTILLPEGPDAGTPVDTGFIVMNEKNYPDLCWFLAQLNVRTQPSDMSLSVEVPTRKVLYSSDLPGGLFARPGNLWSIPFYCMIREIFRFYRQAREDLEAGRVPAGSTLGEYLKKGGYSETFAEDHLIPMAAAIWSVPPGKVPDFPVLTFLRFYQNHGLLSLTQKPLWRTIAGGSHSYVRVFEKNFQGEILLNTPALAVKRHDNGVEVRTAAGSLTFDRVVIAGHADEALVLLQDPSAEESRLLGAWRYSSNQTVLHRDTKMMPPVKRAWASWNVFRDDASGAPSSVAVTYYMNRLQRLRTSSDYFVTLNRETSIESSKVIGSFLYHHPVYDFASLGSQEALQALNGRRNTYYCGGYFGHGFHEDAIRSGFKVAELLGVSR